MSLVTAISNLREKLLALSGVKEVPASPPESINQFPCAVIYARSGRLQLGSAGFALAFDTVFCELFFGRAILPKAVEVAMPYRDQFFRAIRDDPQLGNTVNEVREVRSEFGALTYQGQTFIGWRFEIDIKTTV